MPKPVLGPRRRTHPLIWCAAVICTVLSVAVILTGLAVFVGYAIIRPKVPSISVANAHLGRFSYDQAGLLTTQLSILIRAENDNTKAHATFYDTGFMVGFLGVEIAKLAADPFDVGKNSSVDLDYEVESSPVPLSPHEMEYVDTALKEDRIVFKLQGHSRTRWRVGVLGSVKFWADMSCELSFRPSNRTYIHNKHCTSKSK